MRKLLGIFGAAILVLSLVSPASAQNQKHTIALIPGLTTDPFYITMHCGAEVAAKDVGANLVFQGGQTFNPTTQVPVLNAIIARHPDVILIAPTDKTQLVAPLRKAHEAGIPVITVDTYIGNGHYQTGSGNADFPLSYIASDNIEGGKIAARALAKAIHDKGKVYVANVKPGISTTDQREEGFKEQMKKYPHITVLQTQYNQDDANTAASQLRAVLARAPDLAGVFGANLFSALGASNGVKNAGKSGKIKVVAFDAPPSIVEDIRKGTVDIAIAQHPATIGFYGVMTAEAVLNGEGVPPAIGTGFTVIDKSNVNDPAVKKFIYSSKCTK